MAAGGLYREDEVDAFLADFDPDSLVVPGLTFAAIGAPAPQVLEELAGREDVVLSHARGRVRENSGADVADDPD